VPWRSLSNACNPCLRLLRRYAPRNDTEDNNIVIARHEVPWRSLSNACNPCLRLLRYAMTREIASLNQTRAMSSRGTKCRGDLIQMPLIPVEIASLRNDKDILLP